MDPHPRPGPHGRPWLPDPGRPVLRAIMIVVAVGPQHHEDALAPDEPGRRVVAEPLGHLRQRQADRPDPPGWIGCHRGGCLRRRWEPEPRPDKLTRDATRSLSYTVGSVRGLNNRT